MMFIPEGRVKKLKNSLTYHCLGRKSMHVKDLASITGQIISMSIAVGNITRLLTRSCYATIEKRTSWNDTLHINTEVRSELEVWLGHIDSLNGIPM